MADSSSPWEAHPVSGGGEPAPRDAPWERHPTAEPGAAEKITAFGKAASGAAVETTATVGGMLMGAGAGAATGPFAPVAVPVGAAAGAAAGFVAGGGLKRLLGTPSVEELPPAVRPFAIAGEVVGASVPIAGGPLVAASRGVRLPPSKVGNLLNRVIDFAGKSPKTFIAGEAAGIGGAALAGGIAESVAPGETGVRLGAEVLGGMFNPTRLVVGAAKGTHDAARMALQSMSAAGRETRAAQILQEIVEEAGEDPAALAALLRDSGIPGVASTSAQKTGSPALIALEAKLASSSARFGAQAKQTAEDGLSTIKNMIIALRGTGDPNALAVAAELRTRYFRTLLAGQLQDAERRAIEAAQKITEDTPKARAELSKVANDILSSTLKEARKAEKSLWSAVPKDAPSNAGNVLTRFEKIREGLLPEEVLPPVVEGFVKRMTETQGVTTSGELVRFRSRALALAREANANGQLNDARILGQMAEAALDDLSSIGARGGGAVDDARRFSFELNETFTRTFAGEPRRTTRTGAARTPPELLLKKALGTGGEAGELRLQEISEATRFLETQQIGDAIEGIETMVDAQERLVRLAAAEAIDPNTGRVSATRLGRFINKNDALLDRFPEVKTELQAAVKSEIGAKELERNLSRASRVIEKEAAFAKLAGVESPVDAISSAVRGKNPVAELKAFAKEAKRGGPEGIQGFQAAVFDHAIRQATDSSGRMSVQKMRAAMLDPLRPGGPSLSKVMQDNGILTEKGAESLELLIDEADKIENALTVGGEVLDEIIQDAPALFDLAARVAGSQSVLATGVASGGGGSILAAHAGAQFAKSALDKVPRARVQSVLIEAAQNPEFAALLLEKPKSIQDQIRLSRQIHAYLLQAGITGQEDQENTGQQ